MRSDGRVLDGKTVAVVVPAYNEETQIGIVLDTMPDFVDRIIVINDCSKDKTADIVCEYIAKEKHIERISILKLKHPKFIYIPFRRLALRSFRRRRRYLTTENP